MLATPAPPPPPPPPPPLLTPLRRSVVKAGDTAGSGVGRRRHLPGQRLSFGGGGGVPDLCIVEQPIGPVTAGIMVKVQVKWQKELFKDLEVELDQPPILFKTQLYTLTGVPPERQKIMVKGGLLKDDGDWSATGVKEGQKLMMMGTADEIPQAPEKPQVFVEDLPAGQDLHAVMQGYTAGLVNLGNTCYMNSTLQYTSNSGLDNNPGHRLTLATRDLFKELDSSHQPVAPFRFLMLLRDRFPQFAQQGQGGAYMQQDAEECWSQLMYTLSQQLSSASPSADNAAASSAGAVVKDIFGIDTKSMLKCKESDEEQQESETVYTFKCHISQDVNFLHEGIKQGLVEEIEKNSQQLERLAFWTKTSKVTRLPQYLTVQFVRFFWKRDTRQKAKILRPVTYPLQLDVYDFCSDDFKQSLDVARKVRREREDAKAGLVKSKKQEDEASAEGSNKQADADVPMADAAAGDKNGATEQQPQQAETPVGQTALYNLIAVLTHKGRSADSGHYVAWVRQKPGQWVCFDDDVAREVREEDVLKLSGGGDWHMAYMCLYKACT
eukprot:jgi/Chlat1/7040/Chrsp56S06708